MIILERKTANNINPFINTYRLINLDTMVISKPCQDENHANAMLEQMQMNEYQDTDNWEIIKHNHLDELVEYAKKQRAVIVGLMIEA